MQWHPELLRQHISPGITEFTQADIPDLRPEFDQAPYWLTNHFLDSFFGGYTYKRPIREILLNFFRRVQFAFTEFHEARQKTFEYLESSSPCNPNVRMYWIATNHWEMFLLQYSIAVDLYNKYVARLGGKDKAFAKDDGSPENRAYTLANRVKHFGGELLDGSSCEITPFWLSNRGLCSTTVELRYPEAASLLRDASKLVEALRDPRQVFEKNSAADSS